MTEKYFTVAEASERLGLNDHWTRVILIETLGLLKAEKIGPREYKISESNIAEFLSKHTVQLNDHKASA